MLKWYRDEVQRDDLPAAQQGDPDLRRRLKVACQVFDHWTSCGAQHAALANRVIDGSVLALQDFVQQNTCPQPQSPAGIDKRHANALSYDEFVDQYMQPNRPVIIKGTNEQWAASQDWVSSDGTVNIESLAEHFADAVVWATETNSQAQQYNRRHEMTFAEFAAYWRQRDDDTRLLYLKDWHFANEFPSHQAYTCPPFFQDDWLNDYYDMLHKGKRGSEPGPCQQDVITSDYRFVYLGPKGSRTPIHADVLRSFSWSTNLAGRKRWLLLPPEHTPLLFDRFGREMAADFGSGADPEQRFPNLAQAVAQVIEVEQGTNEALFVPSGWHHSVENLEDTLSINHNWLNGFNIHWGWQHLQEEHASAARAIEDVRSMTSPAEFDQLVQRNMAANCGLNYLSMSHFMGSIAVRQIRRLRQAPSRSSKCFLADAFSLSRCTLVLRVLLSAMSCHGVVQDLVCLHHVNEDCMHRLDCALRILQGGSGSTDKILAALSDLCTASVATLEAFQTHI